MFLFEGNTFWGHGRSNGRMREDPQNEKTEKYV